MQKDTEENFPMSMDLITISSY